MLNRQSDSTIAEQRRQRRQPFVRRRYSTSVTVTIYIPRHTLRMFTTQVACVMQMLALCSCRTNQIGIGSIDTAHLKRRSLDELTGIFGNKSCNAW